MELQSKKNAGLQQWININNDYVLPRSFLENCVIFIKRSKTTLIIHSVDNIDMCIVFDTEFMAMEALKNIGDLLNEEKLECKIDFTFNSDNTPDESSD